MLPVRLAAAGRSEVVLDLPFERGRSVYPDAGLTRRPSGLFAHGAIRRQQAKHLYGLFLRLHQEAIHAMMDLLGKPAVCRKLDRDR